MLVTIGTKVKPETKNQYETELKIAKEKGKITKAEEFLLSMLEDYKDNEKKRLHLENCNEFTTQAFDYLQKAASLLLTGNELFIEQKSELEKEFEERLNSKSVRIKELEKTIVELKLELKKQVIEANDYRRAFDKIEKMRNEKTARSS
ncbi:MAG: hypothetical protein WBV93_18360 [Anaerobacillus sp.]